MNRICSDLKLLQQMLRREHKGKTPRHCGICSVNYMCNYDIDGFCFWKKEYDEQNIIEEVLE